MSDKQYGDFPLVLVDWLDSCENCDNSDQELHDLPVPQRIFQAGFMVAGEDDYIVIASAAKIELGTVDYAIAIPRCSITAIHYLTAATDTRGETE